MERTSRRRGLSRRTARPCSPRRLRLEPLERRDLLSASFPTDGWQSALFDQGYQGTLDFSFSRDAPTISPTAEPLGAHMPRYGPQRLVTSGGNWTPVWDANFTNGEILGSGWDHDGTTPLAVVVDWTNARLFFLRGEDFKVHSTLDYRVNNNDLLRGAVVGFRYRPSHAIVHEGLIVFQAERSRIEGDSLIPEGISFVYTQDYGATFQRVAQVGGGLDVPPLAHRVTDRMTRGARWSFSNAFPETSADDTLGAWFPWADYLIRHRLPRGGQIGLFRARRPAVGQPWVVEPNVVLYELWDWADDGGLHAHSAGMFADGLVSFWGDVDNRNHMVRHAADDLENYTTTTWTHNREFQGAFSPWAAPVYRIGNQGGSTAPAANFGDVLVAGDEQTELVMKVQAPPTPRADFNRDGYVDADDLLNLLTGMGTNEARKRDGDADADGDVDNNDLRIWREELGTDASKAVITSLKASLPGPQAGGRFTPRSSLWIHRLRGRGYVLLEYNIRLENINAIHFSTTGETWTSLLNAGGTPYLYGDRIIAVSGGDLLATPLPQFHKDVSPLILHPGGTNLAGPQWSTLEPPPSGNRIRRVEFDGSLFVYADSGQPITPQPVAPPPVAAGLPIWEFTSTAADRNLGRYQVGALSSTGNQMHWFTAWHYSLNGDGIDPQIQIGPSAQQARASRWVANQQWVPGNNFGVPSSTAAEGLQSVKFTSGNWPGPRRWLMAVEAFVEAPSPIYPLAPGASGPNELATLGGFEASAEWTVGLVFGLPQQIGFSSWFDPAGLHVTHPIGTVYEDADSYLEVSFARTDAAAGTVFIEVYDDGVFTGRLQFESVHFDALDRAQLVIASTPLELAATLHLPRNQYGSRSLSVSQSGGLQPQEIRLSSADQTTVSPLEWYAIQVHPQLALSTAQREAFAISGEILSLMESAEENPIATAATGMQIVLPFVEATQPGPLGRDALKLRAAAVDTLHSIADGRLGDSVSALRSKAIINRMAAPHDVQSPAARSLRVAALDAARGRPRLKNPARPAIMDAALTIPLQQGVGESLDAKRGSRK